MLCLSAFSAQAQNLGNLYQLSEDGREIVMKLPVAKGLKNGKFELSPEEATLAKNVSGIDQHVNEFIQSGKKKDPYDDLPSLDCQTDFGRNLKAAVSKKVSKRDYQSYYTVTSYEEDVLTTEDRAYARLESTRNGYTDFVQRERRKGNFRVENVATLEDLNKVYKTNNPDVDIDNMIPMDQEIAYNRFLREYLGVTPPRGVITEELLFNSSQTSSEDWKKIANKSKDQLTLEQKVSLVTRMGAKALLVVEDEKTKNEAIKGMGIASDLAQVHDAFKYKKRPEAIRAVGLAQSKWLKALGLEDPYVVGFRAAMGDESATVAFDPKTQKFVAIGGPRGKGKLKDVFDSEGRLLKKINPDLLKIFQDVGRGNNGTYLNHKYIVQKMGFESGDMSGHIFVGTTTKGEKLYGAALTKNYNSKHLDVESGAGYGRTPTDKKNDVNVSYKQVYARLAEEVKTSTYDIHGAKIQASIRNENEWLKKDINDESGKSTEVRGLIQPKVKAVREFNDGATKVKGEVTKSIYPSWDQTDVKVVNKERYAVKSGFEQQVTSTLSATVDNAVMFKDYSTVIVNDIGLADDKKHLRMSVGTETALTTDPNAPESIRQDERTKIKARLEKGFVKQNLVITVDLSRQGDDKQIYLQGEMKF